MSPRADDMYCVPMIIDIPERQKLQPTDRQKPRKVQFDENISVLDIPHISDFSIEEIHSTWYTSQEYLVRKEIIRTTIHLMSQRGRTKKRLTHDRKKNNKEDHPYGICTDGLLSTKERNKRKEKRLATLNALLMEQELQMDEGLNDPEMIATACIALTSFSQWKALDRGRRHAHQVTCFYAQGKQE